MARKFAAADPAGKSKFRAAFENKPVPTLPKRRVTKGRSRAKSRREVPDQTTSLTRAVADVAGRLADPGFVRFSAAEVTTYVLEALRTWNALTGHFRSHGTFETVNGQPFHDLA